MLVCSGSETSNLQADDLRRLVFQALDTIESEKKRTKVLVIPPDFTRYHSKAGEITEMVYEYYGDRVDAVMPALGTHHPMSEKEIKQMFGQIPLSLFKVHNWREDVVTIGEVPEELVLEASEGRVKEKWPAQLNKLVWDGGHDLVLSIGQVVPHEVMGMANYNKNLFVGVGGSKAIHFSHFIGAVYGMERMMGRADNPLRKILDYATEHFLKNKLDVVYFQTVIGPKLQQSSEGPQVLQTRGLYISRERDCFEQAAKLSLKVNFSLLDAPLKKVVVYLDPEEFKSTWLGNKSVYRTRMAIADGGELIVLAPGVERFGEDNEIDAMIRKFGYRSTPEVLEHLTNSRDLMRNLSAAAHLIHGTSEGRFSITYCPGHLSKEEIESVGYNFSDLDTMLQRYNPDVLKPGMNTVGDEQVYFVPNPAIGLWAFKGRFNHSEQATSIDSNIQPMRLNPDLQKRSADVSIGGGPFENPNKALKKSDS